MYEVPPTSLRGSLMAHMDRISMSDINFEGVSELNVTFKLSTEKKCFLGPLMSAEVGRGRKKEIFGFCTDSYSTRTRTYTCGNHTFLSIIVHSTYSHRARARRNKGSTTFVVAVLTLTPILEGFPRKTGF